jgi:hypothetical protein
MWEQGKGLNVQPFPPELREDGVFCTRRSVYNPNTRDL